MATPKRNSTFTKAEQAENARYVAQGKVLTELVGCRVFGFSPEVSFGIEMPDGATVSIPMSLADAICKLQKPNEQT